MSVRLLQGTQITLGEQVEDKPVVALGQNLGGDASGLLGHQDRPQVVLTPFLHPGAEGPLPPTGRSSQDRLGLLHDRDRRDATRVSAGKLLLVMFEDTRQDYPG